MMAQYQRGLEEWPIAPESINVDTRYGKTHLLAVGDAALPPLFYFHGWGGNAAGLPTELDLPTITRHFRVYCPDTIGQTGRSAPQRPSTVGSAYGEWIVDVFDALKIRSANVMGISGGGYLTLKLSAYAPDRVQKAMAISTAGVVPASLDWSTMLRIMPAMLFPSVTTARWFTKAMSAPDTPVTQTEKFAQGMALFFKHYRYERAAPAPLTDQELSRITAPLHIRMGAHERNFDVAKVISRIKSHVPHATVEVVEDLGHIQQVSSASLISYFEGK